MTAQAQPLPDTRARLVEAARHLFWEKGYAATGLAEILARARANSGSFYHFFESKDALLRTVLETYVELLEPHVLHPVRKAARQPLDQVFGLLASYRQRLVGTDCQYGWPIGRLALELDPENTPAHELIAANFDAWKSAVAAAVRDAGIGSAEEVAIFVLAVMEGAVMQSRAHRSIEPFDACVRQLRIHLDALKKAPASRPRVRKISTRRPR